MSDHAMHHEDAGTGHVTAPDPAASLGMHGQLLFGQETIYLSHLPMFMFDADSHPHNFQVILEVTLSSEDGDPQAAYVEDRRRSGSLLYTFVPQPFSMSDLVSTNPAQPPLRAFSGTIVRGHFERGGTPILRDVQVEVRRVVYFQQFDPDAAALPALEYLLFGGERERFVAHVITRPPDFDQVLSVELDGHAFDAGALRNGIRLVFSGRENTISARLQAGERLQAVAHLAGDGERTVGVEVEAQTEFYFEAGELAMAM